MKKAELKLIVKDLEAMIQEIKDISVELKLPFSVVIALLQHREILILNRQLGDIQNELREKK